MFETDWEHVPPPPPEKVGWTSSESGSDSRGGLREGAAAAEMPISGDEQAATDVHGRALYRAVGKDVSSAVKEKGQGSQLENLERKLKDAEVVRERRTLPCHGVDDGPANTTTNPLSSTYPSIPTASVAVHMRARTQGSGTVRAAIEMFERKTQSQDVRPSADETAPPPSL